MKPIKIFFFSLIYFLLYFAISLGIEAYFGLQTNFAELLLIGLFFDLILVVLLVFDVPEKIAEKFEKKEERVLFCITNEAKNYEDVAEFKEVFDVNTGKVVKTKVVKTPNEEKVTSENQVKTEDKEENIY